MQKRLLSLLIVLCLTLALVPVPAQAAEGEISTVDGLINAINNSDAETISIANPIVIESGVEIDFGGRTVEGTNDGGYLFSIMTADPVILKNGTLENKNGNGIHSPRADNGYSSGRKVDLTLEKIEITTKDWTIVNRTGGTMTLKNCDVTSGGCAIENNGKMTIEGGTFTSKSDTPDCSVILCASDSYKDDISKGGLAGVPDPNLTITGAKIENKNGIGVTSANGGSVIIGSGTTIDTEGNALGGNNLAPEEIITIKEGAKLTSKSEAGIYMAAAGTLNVEGGEITGKVGIAVRSGTVTVTGGTIIATADTEKIQVGDKTTSITAAGIVVDVVEKYLTGGSEPSVTISGNASVNAAGNNPAVAVSGVEDSKKKDTLKITGGTFSTDPTEFIDASVRVENKDGKFTVEEKTEQDYTLTVTDGTGSGKYAAGAEVTITANAAPDGKVFDKWTTSNGGTFADKDKAETTFTMPDHDVTVTATYKDADTPTEQTYTLTVTGGTGGGKYAAGAEVTIAANAAPDGKVFDKWTTNNGGSFASDTSASTKFTMPAADVTVTAAYKDAQTTTDPTKPEDPANRLYNIYLPNVVGGTVTAPALSSYAGIYIPLTVIPVRDYQLDYIFLTDEIGNMIPVSYSGGQYWFFMPSSNVTIYVGFVLAGSNTVPGNNTSASRPTSRPGVSAKDALAIDVFTSKVSHVGSVSYSIDFVLSANVTGGTGSYSYQFEVKQNGKLTKSTGWTNNNIFSGYLTGGGACIVEITVKDSSDNTASTTVALVDRIGSRR